MRLPVLEGPLGPSKWNWPQAARGSVTGLRLPPTMGWHRPRPARLPSGQTVRLSGTLFHALPPVVDTVVTFSSQSQRFCWRGAQPVHVYD